MGKKARIRRERKLKSNRIIQEVVNEDREIAQSLASAVERVRKHLRQIEPDIDTVIRDAIINRLEKYGQVVTRLTLLRYGTQLLTKRHIPKRPCPDCGIDCKYQREPPLPSSKIIIDDRNPRLIYIRIADTPKLCTHYALNRHTLSRLLRGDPEEEPHTKDICKSWKERTINEIKYSIKTVTADLIRSEGTADLTAKAQQKLKYHIAKELNDEYDLNINPRERVPIADWNKSSTVFLKFYKDGTIFKSCVAGPLANQLPSICAVCMYLPCECPPDDMWYELC